MTNSSEDIKNLFFSKNNLDFTYEQVKRKVSQNVDYDISRNKNLKNNYEKMSLLVYDTTNPGDRNLVNLNNLLVEKSGDYFCKLINNKRNKKASSSSNQIDNSDLDQIGSPNMINQERVKQLKKITSNIPEGDTQLYMPLSGNNSNEISSNNIKPKKPTKSVLPFTLSDEFIEEVENSSSSLYNNMDILRNNEDKDPMSLMTEKQNNRELEMTRYTKELEQLKENAANMEPNHSLSANNELSSQYEPIKMSIGRDDALINTRIDLVEADPQKLFKKNEDLTNRMTASMDINTIGDNSVDNTILDKLTKSRLDDTRISQERIDQVNNRLFQNTKYNFDRRPAQLVVIQKVFTNDNTDVSFKEDLIEPLIIDGHADVFLEFINFQNIDVDGQGHLENINCFALQIDELPLKTASNNGKFKDKYIIPNEAYGLTDDAADVGQDATSAKSHNVKLKTNYMCTVNPMKISSFNIKLYGVKGADFTLLSSNGASSTSQLIMGIYIRKL